MVECYGLRGTVCVARSSGTVCVGLLRHEVEDLGRGRAHVFQGVVEHLGVVIGEEVVVVLGVVSNHPSSPLLLALCAIRLYGTPSMGPPL